MQKEEIQEWNDETTVHLDLELNPLGYLLLVRGLANVRDNSAAGIAEQARKVIGEMEGEVDVDMENAMLSLRGADLADFEVLPDE